MQHGRPRGISGTVRQSPNLRASCNEDWLSLAENKPQKADYERINLMSTQTTKQEMHDWTRAMDVTWALVWLITGLLFVLAPLYVPA